MIGHHNYCTQVMMTRGPHISLTFVYCYNVLQNLVNLLLVGRAVSNTHNGTITLGTRCESVSIIDGEIPCVE